MEGSGVLVPQLWKIKFALQGKWDRNGKQGSRNPPRLPTPGLDVQTYLNHITFLFAGKVLVHCAMGISRSATLVLAFLMIYENKNLVEALKIVREHRGVCPNTGFLSQLRELDLRLMSEKGKATGRPWNFRYKILGWQQVPEEQLCPPEIPKFQACRDVYRHCPEKSLVSVPFKIKGVCWKLGLCSMFDNGIPETYHRKEPFETTSCSVKDFKPRCLSSLCLTCSGKDPRIPYRSNPGKDLNWDTESKITLDWLVPNLVTIII